jgi:hypothetical protein
MRRDLGVPAASPAGAPLAPGFEGLEALEGARPTGKQ